MDPRVDEQHSRPHKQLQERCQPALDEGLHRAMQEHHYDQRPRLSITSRPPSRRCFLRHEITNYRQENSYVRDFESAEGSNRLQKESSEAEETGKGGSGESHGLASTVGGDWGWGWGSSGGDCWCGSSSWVGGWDWGNGGGVGSWVHWGVGWGTIQNVS